MKSWVAGTLVAAAFVVTGQAQQTVLLARLRSTNLVSLHWQAVTGASSYWVRRTSDYPAWETPAYSGSGTSAFVSVVVNRAYVFSIIARNAQGQDIAVSTNALVTTYPYADVPLETGETKVSSQHIADLRAAVTAACIAVRRPAPSWTWGAAQNDPIRKEDISDLRTQMTGVLQALAITVPTYTDPVLSSATPIRRAHVDELRARARNAPEWPELVSISQSEPYFSPNGDGTKDVDIISATVDALDARWQLVVKNAGGTAVRAVSGTGNVIAYPWDGRDGTGTVQADGNYTAELVDQPSGMTVTAVSIVIDNTQPTVAITTPLEGATLSNVRQAGSDLMAIKGEVGDANLTSWRLEHQGPRNATIAQGTSAIAQGATIGSWDTLPANPNGAYTLSLFADDRAGNTATTTAHVTLGNFSARQNVHQVRSVAGDLVHYTSYVPFALTEQLTIKNAQGTVVRSLVNQSRAAGTFIDAWDGKDDAGVLVPDGLYSYVATATAAPDTMTWDTSQERVGGSKTQYPYPYCYNTSNTLVPCDGSGPFDFDPWAGKPLRIAFCVDESANSVPPSCQGTQPALVIANVTDAQEIAPTCYPANCFFSAFRPSGQHEIEWFGMNANGDYIAGPSRMTIIREFDAVPTNAVLVYGTEPKIHYAGAEPLWLGPGYGATQTFNLEIDAYGSRTVALSAAFIEADQKTTLRTVTTPQAAEGSRSITWDGRADNGMFVAPGRYIVRITATDSGGSSSTLTTMTTVRY